MVKNSSKPVSFPALLPRSARSTAVISHVSASDIASSKLLAGQPPASLLPCLEVASLRGSSQGFAASSSQAFRAFFSCSVPSVPSLSVELGSSQAPARSCGSRLCLSGASRGGVQSSGQALGSPPEAEAGDPELAMVTRVVDLHPGP